MQTNSVVLAALCGLALAGCLRGCMALPAGLWLRALEREEKGWYTLWSLGFSHWVVLFGSILSHLLHTGATAMSGALWVLALSGLVQILASLIGLTIINLRHEAEQATA